MESHESTAQPIIHPALNVIGLMSGTSVDSIDAACVRIQLASHPLKLLQLTVLGTASAAWEPKQRHDLLALMAKPESVSLTTLSQMDTMVAESFAALASELTEQLLSEGFEVDCIASHGQTIFHMPPSDMGFGNSLQIGQPALIAQRLGIPVVGDFRPRDMAVGGQGAPLVPFADYLLFADPYEAKAIQNIGGIANVTVLPPTQSDQVPFAFDTGPGNMVIDGLCQTLFNLPYDDQGALAQQGRFSAELLDKLMMNPYFGQQPPKSTGREQFGKAYVDALILEWRKQWESTLTVHDLLATATHLTAISIVESYKSYVLPRTKVTEVIVGGGGTQNPFLMRLLTNRFRECGIRVSRHQDYQIPDQYKEAIAFALLGYATMQGIPNNIPSCTGASHPVVLGAVWPGHPKDPFECQAADTQAPTATAVV